MESLTDFSGAVLFLYVLWTTLIQGVFSAEFCYNGYRSYTYYCDYGCCGDGWNRYCCTFSLTGVIAGCIIGVIAVIAFLAFFFFYYKKRKGQNGQVVAPASNTVAMVNTTVQPNNSTFDGTANKVGNRMLVTSTHLTAQPYPGQPYPNTAYGSVYPPPYSQTQGLTPQINNQPVYPPVSQTSGQVQYPTGPQPPPFSQ